LAGRVKAPRAAASSCRRLAAAVSPPAPLHDRPDGIGIYAGKDADKNDIEGAPIVVGIDAPSRLHHPCTLAPLDAQPAARNGVKAAFR
jgi:hypothetical protein